MPFPMETPCVSVGSLSDGRSEISEPRFPAAIPYCLSLEARVAMEDCCGRGIIWVNGGPRQQEMKQEHLRTADYKLGLVPTFELSLLNMANGAININPSPWSRNNFQSAESCSFR